MSCISNGFILKINWWLHCDITYFLRNILIAYRELGANWEDTSGGFVAVSSVPREHEMHNLKELDWKESVSVSDRNFNSLWHGNPQFISKLTAINYAWADNFSFCACVSIGRIRNTIT